MIDDTADNTCLPSLFLHFFSLSSSVFCLLTSTSPSLSLFRSVFRFGFRLRFGARSSFSWWLCIPGVVRNGLILYTSFNDFTSFATSYSFGVLMFLRVRCVCISVVSLSLPSPLLSLSLVSLLFLLLPILPTVC